MHSYYLRKGHFLSLSLSLLSALPLSFILVNTLVVLFHDMSDHDDVFGIGLSKTDFDCSQQCVYSISHSTIGKETYALKVGELQADGIKVKKESANNCHLRNLNTYYHPKGFNESRDPPLHVGNLHDHEAFHKVEISVEELLIKNIGEEEYHVPVELRGFQEVIEMGINFFHHHIGGSLAKDYCCYVTTTEGIVPPNCVQRFKAIHADGLLGAKHRRDDGTYSHKLSYHMNLCSNLPTNFYIQALDVAALNPSIHDFCKYFEKHVDINDVFLPKPYEMVMFDGYALHSSPCNTSQNPVHRRFFSLEFAPRLYDTDHATINVHYAKQNIYPQFKKYSRIYLATKTSHAADFVTREALRVEKRATLIAGAIAEGKYSEALKIIDDTDFNLEKPVTVATICQQGSHVCVIKGDYDKALQYLEKALSETLIRSTETESVLMNDKGNVLRHQGKYKLALAAYENAKSLAQKCENASLEATITGNISFIYRCFEKPEEAVKQALLQLKTYEKQGLGGTRNSAICHSNIGINLRLIGKLNESLAEQQIAHSIAETLQDEDVIISTAITMASSYRSIGDKINAVQYYNKAYLLAEKDGNQAELMHLAQVEKIFCELFYELTISSESENEPKLDIDDTLQTTLIASCEALTAINSSYQAKAYNVLGRLYFLKKDFTQATEVYTKALSLAETSENVFELGLARLGQGLVYIEQGLEASCITDMLNGTPSTCTGTGTGTGSAAGPYVPRYTACMAAAFMGWTHDLRGVLSHGADYTLYDEKGYTLFDYANLNNHLETVCEGICDVVAVSELTLLCDEVHLKSLIRLIVMDKLEGADTAARIRQQFRTNFTVTAATAVVEENSLLVKVPELLDETRVISFDEFKQCGMMPHSSQNLATVIPTEDEDKVKVIFVSHRWLRPHYCEGCQLKTCGKEGNPDEADNSKWQNIIDVVTVIATQLDWDPTNIRLWIDFSSLDQSNIPRLLAGTHTLPFYVMSSDAFICLHNDTYWQRSWCLVEAMFAQLSYETHGFPLRFQVSATGAVTPIAASVKAVPSEGALTTELDRRNVRFLEMVAKLIM